MKKILISILALTLLFCACGEDDDVREAKKTAFDGFYATDIGDTLNVRRDGNQCYITLEIINLGTASGIAYIDGDTLEFSSDGVEYDLEWESDNVVELELDSSWEYLPDGSKKIFRRTEGPEPAPPTPDAPVLNERTAVLKLSQDELYNAGAVAEKKYIPKITLYNDNTFEFLCNYYEGMITYTGTYTQTGSKYSCEIDGFLLEDGTKSTDLEYAPATAFELEYDDVYELATFTCDAYIGMTGGKDNVFCVEE